jgi:hypothetical protein
MGYRVKIKSYIPPKKRLIASPLLAGVRGEELPKSTPIYAHPEASR